MDASVSTAEMDQRARSAKWVSNFVLSFEALSLDVEKLHEIVPEPCVDNATAALKQTRRRTLRHIMLSMLGSVLVFLLTIAIVFCMLLYVEHSVQYAEAATSKRIYEVVSPPTRVHELKRVLKVVERMPEGMPVDVSLLMRSSLFDRTLRPKVTHFMPVQAVVAGPFKGTLPLSTSLVPVVGRVDTTLTTHVPVPVETYTQWMLFMQSMSVVKRVEKTKPSAEPPACVCPSIDAKDDNNTSKDAPVEIVNEQVWNGVCTGMAIVGFAVVGTVVGSIVVSFIGGVIATVTGVGID
jgi:hypothetical protein